MTHSPLLQECQKNQLSPKAHRDQKDQKNLKIRAVQSLTQLLVENGSAAKKMAVKHATIPVLAESE